MRNQLRLGGTNRELRGPGLNGGQELRTVARGCQQSHGRFPLGVRTRVVRKESGRDRYRRRVLLLKRRLLCQNCVRTIECESGLSGRIALARGPRCSYSFRFDHIEPNIPRVVRELKILGRIPDHSSTLQSTPAHSSTYAFTGFSLHIECLRRRTRGLLVLCLACWKGAT